MNLVATHEISYGSLKVPFGPRPAHSQQTV